MQENQGQLLFEDSWQYLVLGGVAEGEYRLLNEDTCSGVYVAVSVSRRSRTTEDVISWHFNRQVHSEAQPEDVVSRGLAERGVTRALEFLYASELDLPQVKINFDEFKVSSAIHPTAVAAASMLATLVSLERGDRAYVVGTDEGWQANFLPSYLPS